MAQQEENEGSSRVLVRTVVTVLGGLLVLQLVRCGATDTTGPGTTTPPADTTTQPGGSGGSGESGSKTFAVDGSVVDSVLQRALSGVTVEIAGQSAITDANGTFHIAEVPSGWQELRVASTPYRVWKDSLDVSRDLAIPVQLWRLAPWLTEVVYDSLLGGTGGSLKVTWGDIEGDFPVDQQQATIAYDTGSVTLPATTVLGITPWRRQWVFPGGRTATGFTMSLLDLAGHRATFSCVPDWVCTEQ